MSRQPGFKLTEDHKAKIRVARSLQSPPTLGLIHSEETKKKMSETAKGRVPVWIKGKLMNDEHKQNISKALRDRSRSRKTVGVSKRFEHIRIACKHLGRQLRGQETVHHIDCNKKNNSVENLFLFRVSGAHSRWHAFIKRHNLEPTLLKSNI